MLLYTYISRFSVNPQHQQKRKICQSCRLKLYLRPSFIAFFNFSHKRPTFAFTVESGYTLAFANRIAHSGSQGETRAFRAGVVSLPSVRFARFRNPAWSGVRTAYFAVLCTGGVCGKEAESLLDIDARTVRRCPEATRSRRNAQPRCWFLRCIGELHGLPSLHPRAERKICCWGCLVFACGVGNSSLVGTK